MTLTSPAGGATVSGIVLVSATAADDREVLGVQFKLDGLPLGAEDVTAPYELSWNTATATTGAHTLTATARDGAGRETTASAVMTVAPDTIAPTVALTSPVSGATVGGVVAVLATAADDNGVVGVQFLLDGASLGAEDTV